MNDIKTLLKEILSDFHKAEKTIISRERKNIRLIVINPLLWLIFMALTFAIGCILDYYLNYKYTSLLNGLLLFPFIWLIFGDRYLKWHEKRIGEKVRDNIRNMIKRHYESLQCLESIESIEEIIEEMKSIQVMMTQDLLYLQQNELRIFEQIMQKEILFCNSILINLRSDLHFRLIEQQSTLTEAKSELEANVKGTTELNSISELQQARLNRQIEQFEELQRVLTRI